MMESYDICRKIEAESRRLLTPAMHEMFNSFHWYPKSAGIEFEKKNGDASGVYIRTKERSTIEHKCEQKNKYGNFFLETWSNKSLRRDGWLWTSLASMLIYHFIDDDIAYLLRFDALRNWATADVHGVSRLKTFPEKKQAKYIQENDTWGRTVPIRIIEQEVGFEEVFGARESAADIF